MDDAQDLEMSGVQREARQPAWLEGGSFDTCNSRLISFKRNSQLFNEGILNADNYNEIRDPEIEELGKRSLDFVTEIKRRRQYFNLTN